MIKIHDWKTLSKLERNKLLERPVVQNKFLQRKVKSIITNVKKNGDSALRELTKKYDMINLDSIAVKECEFVQAENNVSKDLKNTINVLINRVTTYQQQSFPDELTINTNDGVICKKILTPIEKIGLYVPGGTAPLVSTLVMLAVPAKLASCTKKILCTPPDLNGKINPILLVTAKLCGIDAVYKIGGAQAIASMAYGTETIEKVDKIFGPGNVWVTQAKQLVSEDPKGAAIDMPAGPSELIVIADEYANAEFVAADLLSQAEHGEESQVLLLTSSKALAKKVKQWIQVQFKKLARKSIIKKSLEISSIIVINNLENAFSISNHYAPEHLSIQVANADNYLKLIRNAGAVFVGEWTAESMGDYINGANHVLPTYGYARYTNGLSVSDFMKYISVQRVSKIGLQSLGPLAMELAEVEGLDAHKNAVFIRLNTLRDVNE